MATVVTAAPGKAPPWRGLNKLSQEQVVAIITVIIADRRPRFATD